MSEEEILIGMALGDGYITKHGNLVVKHSTKQMEYLNYKRQILIDNGFKFGKDLWYPPTGYGVNPSVGFRTSSTSLGKRIRQLLYPNGKKVVPDDVRITPFMWAILYQDDGRQNKSNHYNIYVDGEKIKRDAVWVNRYTIYTDSFDIDSINNLIVSLRTYDIESSINYSNKNKHPHLHIYKKESKENFKSMILPFVCESMFYKVDACTSIEEFQYLTSND